MIGAEEHVTKCRRKTQAFVPTIPKRLDQWSLDTDANITLVAEVIKHAARRTFMVSFAFVGLHLQHT